MSLTLRDTLRCIPLRSLRLNYSTSIYFDFTEKVAEIFAKDAKQKEIEVNVLYTLRCFALYSFAIFAVKPCYFNPFQFYRKGRGGFRKER